MTPFALFDRAAQAVVDRTMFALMRSTGWPRSLIRYRIAMGPQLVAALTLAGSTATRHGIWLGAVAFIVFVGLTALLAPTEKRADESAEGRGLGRVKPRRLVTVLMVALAALPPIVPLRDIPAAAFWLIAAFLEYAAATPPAPPATRSLVLARSAS